MKKQCENEKPTPSRYQRVQQILDEAQGGTIPDYQGLHAFWRLPLPQFLEAELYGQRLIAPPPEGDCECDGCEEGACDCHTPAPQGDSGCSHCDPTPAAVTTPNCWPTSGSGGDSPPTGGSTARSEASALIKGLRGEAPFDGTIFQPLLWRAARAVTESEVAFIAAWIDAGCPETDDDAPPQASLTSSHNNLLALACGERQHTVADQPLNRTRQEVNGLKVRKEVSTLTPEELRRLRQAIRCMYQYNTFHDSKNRLHDERSFDYWAAIHTNSCQHGWEQFLPWHRLYLYFFEQQLQDYDPLITLPYWDWAAYAPENTTSFNTVQLDTGVIPEAYHCWLDTLGLARLKEAKNAEGKRLFTSKEIASLEKIKETTYNSGLRLLNAAKISFTLDPFTTSLGVQDYRYSPKIKAIYDTLLQINPLWHANRWPGAAFSPTHYPTQADVDAILNVIGFAPFGGGPEYDHHFGALEEAHNGMHNFSGGTNPEFKQGSNLQSLDNPSYGDMVDNRVTAFDPMFWGHHSNVDRLWAVWQERNPNVNPVDMAGSLPPWSLAVRDTLSVQQLGYEYMKDAYFYPTANHLAITRFNSRPVGVPSGVLDSHRKAEIRLHRLQKAACNASIRVFLNAPDANVETPIQDNDHYVGQITTFGGTCYGGPGHCDVPLPRTRQFDLRPLHHNEPRNYRLDATAAVQRLLAKGAEDLSIHLVAVDLDGSAADRALFFDGVSLNFLD